jgi:hypothetical protein
VKRNTFNDLLASHPNLYFVIFVCGARAFNNRMTHLDVFIHISRLGATDSCDGLRPWRILQMGVRKFVGRSSPRFVWKCHRHHVQLPSRCSRYVLSHIKIVYNIVLNTNIITIHSRLWTRPDLSEDRTVDKSCGTPCIYYIRMS